MPTREESRAQGTGRPGAAHGPAGRGAVAVPLAAAPGDGVRGRAVRELAGGRAVGLPGAGRAAGGGLRAAGPAPLRRRRARASIPQTAPVEWALAASRRGQRREAAEVLARAGYLALAALELDAANDPRGARACCGSGCCATSGCATAPTRRRWCTSTGPRRCGGWATAGPPAGPAAAHPGAARGAGRRVRAPRASASGPSTATACCCGWGATRARSRTWPRAT